MGSFHKEDMYDFIDGEESKSIYTILNEYHPFLNNNFSLANLINHVPDIQYVNSGKIFIQDYKSMVTALSELLLKETSITPRKNEAENFENKLNKIFDELKEASRDNTDCKFFSTIREYIEYAQRNLDNPETKGLRDAIVNNAVADLSTEDIYKYRERLLTVFYLSQAENRVKALHPMKREPGQIPEWDRLQAIRKIITRKGALRKYDEYYNMVSPKIQERKKAVEEEEKLFAICKMERATYVDAELAPTKASASKPETSKAEDLFEEIKEEDVNKGDNSWSITLLEEPELLCDLEAVYSQDGVENQRVVAYRYGRFKYTNTQEKAEGFSIDTTDLMPELVGISRTGNDGSKFYFVLMPPIDRIVYRPINDKKRDPGDRPFNLVVREDVEVRGPSGRRRVEKQIVPTNVVDAKTGKRLNIFRNKDIPEELEDFFAKVYFSDEYLSSVVKHNARYLGSVEQTENGPVIHPTDEQKFDLRAAHYAKKFPGRVDRVMIENLDIFCNSHDLKVRQYNLVNERERSLSAKAKQAGSKKDEGQGFDD